MSQQTDPTPGFTEDPPDLAWGMASPDTRVTKPELRQTSFVGQTRFEATGSDHGARFQALEAGDFVFELLEAFLLGADDLDQLPHQRRGFGIRNVLTVTDFGGWRVSC